MYSAYVTAKPAQDGFVLSCPLVSHDEWYAEHWNGSAGIGEFCKDVLDAMNSEE